MTSCASSASKTAPDAIFFFSSELLAPLLNMLRGYVATFTKRLSLSEGNAYSSGKSDFATNLWSVSLRNAFSSCDVIFVFLPFFLFLLSSATISSASFRNTAPSGARAKAAFTNALVYSWYFEYWSAGCTRAANTSKMNSTPFSDVLGAYEKSTNVPYSDQYSEGF